MTEPSSNLAAAHTKAMSILGELRRVAVAFSGGADSTLALKLAMDSLGPAHVLAVTGNSPSVAESELAEAPRLAAILGAEHAFLETHEFDEPLYLSNPTNRCYYCKTTLYRQMHALAKQRGLSAIVNGTNLDDLSDHRPGLVAAKEHQVCSPLSDARFTKSMIRELSARLGLVTAQKPASPCLSSRIPYGQPVTLEKVRRIDRAEEYLKGMGFPCVRVRHFGDTARVEVAQEDLPRLLESTIAGRVTLQLRTLGFENVMIDPEGFRSGRLNEVIAFGKSQN